MPVAGPIIAAVVSVVATVAGGAVQYAQAKQASKAKEKAADYNKQVAGQQSAVARAQANIDAEQMRSRNRRIISSQQARYAKSGITQTGTVLDVKRDSEMQGELEVMNRIHKGNLEAAGYNNQAGLFGMEADQARSGGGLLAAGAIASTAGGVAGSVGSYYSGKSTSGGGFYPGFESTGGIVTN